MHISSATHWWKLAVLFLAILKVVELAPALHNGDDFVRYYFGGYAVRAWWFGTAEERKQIEDSFHEVSRLPTRFAKSRFWTTAMPYSLTNVGLVQVGEFIRHSLPLGSPLAYILNYYSGAWFLFFLLVVLLWPQVSANPSRLWCLMLFLLFKPSFEVLSPVPRAVAGALLALAFGLVVQRRNLLLGNLLFVAGAFAHVYQHVINLSILALMIVYVRPPQVMNAIKQRPILITLLIQPLVTFAVFGLVTTLTLSENVKLGVITGSYSAMDSVGASIQMNLKWVLQRGWDTVGLTIGIAGLATAVHKGRRFGILAAVIVLLTLVPTLLLGSDYYAGQYLQRLCLAFNSTSLILLLLWDSQPALRGVQRVLEQFPVASRVAALALIALVLARAFEVPEDWSRNLQKQQGPVETLALEALP